MKYGLLIFTMIFMLSCQNQEKSEDAAGSKAAPEKQQQPVQQTKPKQNTGGSRIIKERQYLSDNKKRPGVVVEDNGLQYEIIKKGTGNSPELNDTAIVIYKGTLIDGTVFDDTQGQPAKVPINTVFPGWSIALKKMKVGSQWRIVIPSDLAFDNFGYRNIVPPHATIIIEAELVDVKKGDPNSDGLRRALQF